MSIFKKLFRRCPHDHVRCVHGDEINTAGGMRRACLDCGDWLTGPLPPRCSITGQLHIHQPEFKNGDSYG